MKSLQKLLGMRNDMFPFFLTVIFLLNLVQSNWIDPDTPLTAHTTNPLHITIASNDYDPSYTTKIQPPTSPHHLIFSDEFNTPGRTFRDGQDPKWTAINKDDYTNDALHFYSHDNAYTNKDGELEIITTAEDTNVAGFDDVKQERTEETKHFKSAMLQSWNKFCFTGGVIEAEVQLPGWGDVGGLWPAFWILGNLARHTYVGSAMHIWPWSADICSMATEYAQKLTHCRKVEHFGMENKKGRGAPEIDIFEVQTGTYKAGKGPFLQMPVGQPFMSASYQVAPGMSTNRPGDGWWPAPWMWYQDLHFGNDTCMNILFYGNFNHYDGDGEDPRKDYWSDAISYNRQLNRDHFASTHKYRLEWDVPDDGGIGNRGYLHWFLDDELILAINGTSLDKAGDGAEISSEPSSIILNTAVSSQWGFPPKCPRECPCEKYDCTSADSDDRCGFPSGFCLMMSQKEPPKYKINWVRVYQDSNNTKHKVGCSTPERPTARYIEANEKLYMMEKDKHPLQSIQNGSGKCRNNYQQTDTPFNKTTSTLFEQQQHYQNICGGLNHGICNKHDHCICQSNWTGPHCLVPNSHDDDIWDEEKEVITYHGPGQLFCVLLGVLLFLLVAMTLIAGRKGKDARDYVWEYYSGFQRIPDK